MPVFALMSKKKKLFKIIIISIISIMPFSTTITAKKLVELEKKNERISNDDDE